MPEEIDEYLPLKNTSTPAKQIFKKVVALELEQMHRENPDLSIEVINIIQDILK